MPNQPPTTQVFDSPTVAPPGADGLGEVLGGNIAAVQARRDRERRSAKLEVKAADLITRFAGSMPFVYVHLAVVALWIACQSGWVPGARFDPTYVILATATSVEGIFLSTFILITQNRQTAEADKRADLDLQINLLAEHEVTRLVGLTQAIATHLGIAQAANPELEELKRDVAPEAVLDDIEAQTSGPDRKA